MFSISDKNRIKTTAVVYLESGCELSDKPYDFVVLDVVVSVLHEVSPQNLNTAQTKSKHIKTKGNGRTSVRDKLEAVHDKKVSNSG